MVRIRVMNGKTKRNGGRRQGRRGNGRNGMRTRADKVLAQGALAVPTRPFGAGCDGKDLRVWDAKLPHHLPLPRAVGPYTTIRVTEKFNSSEQVFVFGTFKYPEINAAYAGEWTSLMCAHNGSGGVNNPINSSVTPATFKSIKTLLNIGGAASLVPSAFSVQMMCTQPIADASGIVYCGNLSTSLYIAGDGRTWNDLASNFISNMNPRICSAGKLALRGVQMNSYPLNMTACADFTPIIYSDDFNDAYNPDKPQPTGWSPIMVVNSSQAQLEFLVTTEWRVRFDPFNPASASHTYHPVSSDQTWGKLMSQAASLGNGVLDIVEQVANAGQMAQRAVNFVASRAGPQMALAGA